VKIFCVGIGISDVGVSIDAEAPSPESLCQAANQGKAGEQSSVYDKVSSDDEYDVEVPPVISEVVNECDIGHYDFVVTTCV